MAIVTSVASISAPCTGRDGQRSWFGLIPSLAEAASLVPGDEGLVSSTSGSFIDSSSKVPWASSRLGDVIKPAVGLCQTASGLAQEVDGKMELKQVEKCFWF